MKKMAHIENGVVVNVSLWDGESNWTPNGLVVEIPEDSLVSIGWAYVDENFIDSNKAESE